MDSGQDVVEAVTAALDRVETASLLLHEYTHYAVAALITRRDAVSIERDGSLWRVDAPFEEIGPWTNRAIAAAPLVHSFAAGSGMMYSVSEGSILVQLVLIPISAFLFCAGIPSPGDKMCIVLPELTLEWGDEEIPDEVIDQALRDRYTRTMALLDYKDEWKEFLRDRPWST